MTDNQLIDLLASRMEAGLLAQTGWRYNGQPYLVSQNNQPTQQGMPYGPMATFEKLFDRRYGWQFSEQLTYDEPNDVFNESEGQKVETTFQISAFVIQDPADLTIPTPSDVVHFMAMWLASRSTIKEFLAQSVELLRVTEVRNPYFEDDRHRNESSPQFDIVLIHNRSLVQTVPAAHRVIGETLPVLP